MRDRTIWIVMAWYVAEIGGLCAAWFLCGVMLSEHVAPHLHGWGGALSIVCSVAAAFAGWIRRNIEAAARLRALRGDP